MYEANQSRLTAGSRYRFNEDCETFKNSMEYYKGFVGDARLRMNVYKPVFLALDRRPVS